MGLGLTFYIVYTQMHIDYVGYNQIRKFIKYKSTSEHGCFSFCLFKCRLIDFLNNRIEFLIVDRQAFASFKHGFFQV